MELRVKRRFFAETYTIGTLYVNGERFSDTLEDKNRDLNKNGVFDGDEKKVYAETAIPFGSYSVIVSRSPKFKRNLPRLQNVPHFDGILIHRGANASHTSGCILVGENKVKGGLINGKQYEEKLTAICKAAQERGERIIITIE